ncbi:hypothetical protein [Neorhizobium vignae]|uniref:hypothetical protein n=1 Tax=Neorhizobium vignae TaxID=690585 RepID=UPI00056240B2|nr:hypothetical protein [Neorhizobium vignae]
MNAKEENEKTVVAISRSVMSGLSAMGTFLLLGWLLTYSSYGIDFTDESFYLVWIADPFIYDVSATQFGFIYHPLYVLLGGDISALRQANIVLTFGLGWGLAYTLLSSLAPEVREARIALHTTAAGLATSTLILFNTWLPTPSYNSLGFQALLITSIGLLLADKAFTFRSVGGWIIIAIGGWLAFMAKPSTAGALAVVVFLCLLASRKLSARLISFSLATVLGLLLLSALIIDGSLLGFAKRLLLSVDFAHLIGSGHTADQILRIDSFRLRTPSKLAILFVAVVTFFAIRTAQSAKPGPALVSLGLSVFFLSITALLVTGQIHKTAGLGQFEGLLTFGLVLAAVLTALFSEAPAPWRSISAPQWAMAIIFTVMPHIYAFGTNRNYWENGAWVGIFWLLAGLTLLGPVVRARMSWSFVQPLVLATQAVTAILLQTGLEQPQRQPQPLRLNQTTVEIGPERSSLILSSGYASYINDALATVQNGGFRLGTPVIDLSGQSPGILYAIGAKSVGLAWIIGGYPGSLQLARAALDRVPCEEIAKAWVLLEPDGPRRIPTELMASLGSAFPEKYQQIGAWRTAEGAGGYDVSRVQELYQPTAPADTLRVCQTLRQSVTK